jgi:signal transduction histidine kinase
MQRLFGLSLVLGSGEQLSAADLSTCHDELQGALRDLRTALSRPMSSHGRPARTSLAQLVERRARRTPEMTVDWAEGVEVPEPLEVLAQSVFLEALRNAEKHARPSRIDVRVAASSAAFELEVINDGIASAAGAGAGLGLRLLTLEALQQDALVEFGSLADERWHVRMVGPQG